MQGVLHLCCLNGWFWGGRVWWVYCSFLLPKCFGHSNPSCKLKYFVSLNMIVVPPTRHAILSLLFRGQRARDAEKLFTGPRSCCNYSELQIQGTEMHSLFNNLLCVCVYLVELTGKLMGTFRIQAAFSFSFHIFWVLMSCSVKWNQLIHHKISLKGFLWKTIESVSVNAYYKH